MLYSNITEQSLSNPDGVDKKYIGWWNKRIFN